MIKEIFKNVITALVYMTAVLTALLQIGVRLTHAQTEDPFYYQKRESYSQYIEKHGNADSKGSPILISAHDYDRSSSFRTGTATLDGVDAVTVDEGGRITYNVKIERDACYRIGFVYYPVAGRPAQIKMELLVDGEVPFSEAESITLRRIWTENESEDYDFQGNQIRLPSVEKPCWIHEQLRDSNGYYQEPFEIFLRAGEHKISFGVFQNTVAFSEDITLTPYEIIPEYCELISDYAGRGVTTAETSFRVEAESPAAKSDRSIVTVNDRSSAATTPEGGTAIVYNSIGGDSWKNPGEWIEWEVEAEESGLYTIVLRFKQDIKTAAVSYRTLYIDGQIPFEEARSLPFTYSSSWQTSALSGTDGEYQIYLEKGHHTIRLEVSLGDYAEIIGMADEAVSELNRIYTDIVMLTGPNPDIDRDYRFELIMPDVLDKMESCSERLKEIRERIDTLTGAMSGEGSSCVERLYTQLDKMTDDPETISGRLNNYLSDITSFASWVNVSREQPLLLDYIMLSNESDGVPDDEVGFWRTLGFHIRQFLYSFAMDYTNVGNKNTGTGHEITVWIASGRDQSNVIRQLINEYFTPESGIGVKLQLVNEGALMPATISGIGPDVYIGMAQNMPVEYALRDALTDLTEFDDCDEITRRFYRESLDGFRLDGGLYALPDTLSYPVMFYRKDIMTELGIRKEDLLTWDSLLQKVLPELDMNSFDFGFPQGINSYGMFLAQNGGSFYNPDNTGSMLNNEEAVTAFERICSLYTDYRIPLAYDFANRFRSGQMPLAVADFTAYNQLSVFAPEIDGLWGIVPVPGTVRDDGTIDNTVICSVSGSVILRNTEYRDEAWEFLKWWSDESTQSRYASELEVIMGTGARYPVSNIEAMKTIDWAGDVRETLLVQQQRIKAMPNIAGGYYTSRYYDFAFRDVVYNGENLRSSLDEAAASITEEIISKRREFYGK